VRTGQLAAFETDLAAPMSGSDRAAQRSDASRPQAVDVDERFDGHGLYSLRAELVACVQRMGATEEWIEGLLIIAGELTSNVVRHGGGAGRLRLWHDENVLYCEVTDGGPGFADPTVGATPPDPGGSDSGRGIWMCRNLATELIIEAGADGRGAMVTAVIPARDHGAPSGGSCTG
jgi:anti-sigma regulatory factor (Ser/Thr protein kinase)